MRDFKGLYFHDQFNLDSFLYSIDATDSYQRTGFKSFRQKSHRASSPFDSCGRHSDCIARSVECVRVLRSDLSVHSTSYVVNTCLQH